MTDDSFYIWLMCSDTYTVSDANSEVALSVLPTTPNYVTEPYWVKLQTTGTDPLREMISPIAQEQTYNLELIEFDFPDEMTNYNTVNDMLLKRWKYICMDGQDSGGNPITENKYPYRLHAVGNAIALDHEYEMEPGSDYTAGTKSLVLKFKKRYLKFST